MTLTEKLQPLKNLVSRHKLVTVLLAILLLVLANMAWNKYQDWDNAQMIKGLARDFPVLIEEIEKETSLNLEIKTNCMTTQEKFGKGVSTCEALVVEHSVTQDILDLQREVAQKQTVFQETTIFENSEGYNYTYRGKNSCEISYQEYIYISCITAVRDANKKLASEEFNKIE